MAGMTNCDQSMGGVAAFFFKLCGSIEPDHEGPVVSRRRPRQPLGGMKFQGDIIAVIVHRDENSGRGCFLSCIENGDRCEAKLIQLQARVES